MTILFRIYVMLALLIMPHLSFRAAAAERTDSLSLKIYFRQDKTEIDFGYHENGAFMARFIDDVRAVMSDSTCTINDIHIRSSASPEGGFLHNRNLSYARGKVLKEYLQKELLIPADKFSIDAVGEDWTGLRDMVERNSVPDREKILAILDRYRPFVDGRPESSVGSPKKELMELNHGRTWNWLLDNIYPDLRSAGNMVVCRFTRISPPDCPYGNTPHTKDTIVIVHEYPVVADTVSGTLPTPPYVGARPFRAKRPRKSPGYRFGVETNLLFDAVAAPNIALEFPIGKRLSLRAEHLFPWYVFDEDRYAYEILNSGLEARWWLGDRSKRSVLTGAHLGIYGAALKSDLEYQSVGNQIPYTWHAGLAGGWSFPLGKRDNWRLDLGLKLGCLPYSYDHYVRSERSGLLIYQNSGEGLWIGPTDVHCSIVWMIPGNKKKEGKNHD